MDSCDDRRNDVIGIWRCAGQFYLLRNLSPLEWTWDSGPQCARPPVVRWAGLPRSALFALHRGACLESDGDQSGVLP